MKNDFLVNLLHSSPIPKISELEPELQQQAAEANWNELFDLEGPRSIERKPRRMEAWWHQRFFSPSTSICKARDALDDISIYIRRFPYKNTSTTKTRFLLHNILGYFQEVYILRERAIAFLNMLRDDYKNHTLGPAIADANINLCRGIKLITKTINEARRSHVHQLGFATAGLSRLEHLEMLDTSMRLLSLNVEVETQVTYRLLYEESYKKQRKHWHSTIMSWNKDIDKYLDHYFGTINALLFHDDKRLLYPFS